ncbi:MAG: terpene cyclase/mutase family protein [Planctomycetes bacterium]|nr:terpene cyclase/mutase family protein [Planctomycetota bacterium]
MRFIPAICLLLAPALAWGQSAEETAATIKYVQKLQQADGGFSGSSLANKSSLRATSAAIRTLKYRGGELTNKEKTIQFVKSCFDEKSGGYSDTPGGKPDVFLTAVGIMAAAELNLPDSPYKVKAVAFLAANAKEFEDLRIAAAGFEAGKNVPKEAGLKWLQEMAALGNPDGSFGKPVGDARMTGSVVVMILRLGGMLTIRERVASLKVLVTGQQPDGGYAKPDAKGSDLETTYRVMRAFHMMLEKPKDIENLRAFIAKCRNADGGYGVAPGQPSNIGATYYASIMQYWMK